jgi:hypothetical protein
MQKINPNISAWLSHGVPILIMMGAFLLLTACALFLPRGVEELVPTDEDAGGMALSPGGDKLIYHSRSSNTPVVLNLVTNQKHKIESKYCGSWRWLDNQTILCWGKPEFNIPPALINDNDMLLSEIKRVTIDDINLSAILSKAGQVFLIEIPYDKPNILILSADYTQSPDNYLVTNLTDAEGLLRDVPYTVIPKAYISDLQSDKMYSPNESYYYVLTSNISLSIYTSKDDRLLVTVPLESNENVKVGGWVYDSSGILYQIDRIGPLGTTSPIYKMNVP